MSFKMMQLNNLDCSAAACCSWKEQKSKGFEIGEISKNCFQWLKVNPTARLGTLILGRSAKPWIM